MNSCEQLSPQTIKEFDLSKDYMGLNVTHKEIQDHIESNIINARNYHSHIQEQTKFKSSEHSKTSRINLELLNRLNQMRNEEKMNNFMKENKRWEDFRERRKDVVERYTKRKRA